jgi:hypothetical protein
VRRVCADREILSPGIGLRAYSQDAMNGKWRAFTVTYGHWSE